METTNHSTSWHKILILLSFLALFVYIAIRAYALSFVHDESISFTMTQGNPAWRGDPNNHFINTFLMTLCSRLFGDSEFSLRLPNVLSFGLYLGSCFYILNLQKNKWLFFLGASLVILHPFNLEFFSLARGYGLSLGFMLASTFFLLRNGFDYKDDKSFLIDFTLTSLFAILATHSSLTMINFLIATLFISFLKFGFYSRKPFKKNAKFNLRFMGLFLATFVPLFYGIKRLLKLNAGNQLYAGTDHLIETLDSLLSPAIYFPIEDHSSLLLFLRYLIISIIPISILLILLKKDYLGKLAIITSLNITIIIGLLLEHYLFGAKFPEGRTALVFVPIFGVNFYYIISHLSIHYNFRKEISAFITLCIGIPLLINFILSLNTTYTTVWKYDAHTKEAMLNVHEKTKNLEQNASISNNWLFQPTIDYYIVSRKMNVNLTNRNGVNHNSDFIYQLDVDPPMQNNYKSIKAYKDIKSNLFMKISY